MSFKWEEHKSVVIAQLISSLFFLSLHFSHSFVTGHRLQGHLSWCESDILVYLLVHTDYDYSSRFSMYGYN